MTNKDKAIKIGSNYPATECVKKKYRFIESESDLTGIQFLIELRGEL